MFFENIESLTERELKKKLAGETSKEVVIGSMSPDYATSCRNISRITSR
jgi:hypothetical protein